MKVKPRRSATPITQIPKADLRPDTREASGFPPVLPKTTVIHRGDTDVETMERSGYTCGFCTRVRRTFARLFSQRTPKM